MNILTYGHINFLDPINFPTEVLVLVPAAWNENVPVMRSWPTRCKTIRAHFQVFSARQDKSKIHSPATAFLGGAASGLPVSCYGSNELILFKPLDESTPYRLHTSVSMMQKEKTSPGNEPSTFKKLIKIKIAIEETKKSALT